MHLLKKRRRLELGLFENEDLCHCHSFLSKFWRHFLLGEDKAVLWLVRHVRVKKLALFDQWSSIAEHSSGILYCCCSGGREVFGEWQECTSVLLYFSALYLWVTGVPWFKGVWKVNVKKASVFLLYNSVILVVLLKYL